MITYEAREAPEELREIEGFPPDVIYARWPDGYVVLQPGHRAILEDPYFDVDAFFKRIRDAQEAAAA